MKVRDIQTAMRLRDRIDLSVMWGNRVQQCFADGRTLFITIAFPGRDEAFELELKAGTWLGEALVKTLHETVKVSRKELSDMGIEEE